MFFKLVKNISGPYPAKLGKVLFHNFICRLINDTQMIRPFVIVMFLKRHRNEMKMSSFSREHSLYLRNVMGQILSCILHELLTPSPPVMAPGPHTRAAYTGPLLCHQHTLAF